jgi:pilus assembly protein Flp/PilA
MARKLRALLHDRRGATAIEYGLILALIAVACVGAFGSFGNALSAKWNYVASTVLSH